jgi:class 3 adenylate cyclase/tetratricopeptide (TPR) repeat protein
MVETLQAQIAKLRTAINGLEAQRAALGEEIVNTALSTLKKQLAELEQQVAGSTVPAEDRRMVTILFTDMVGSTSLAGKLDPEEWRRIVSKTHSAIGEAITSHHGTIAQYLGDGLLAFFGAKEASENDPENAIRAALDAQAAVGAVGGSHTSANAALAYPTPVPALLARAGQAGTGDSPLQEPPLPQIRVGIHTGLVVVGELGAEMHKEFTASGDAMNLAARLQSAAPPGGVLISHDTYRYVRGVFDVTPRPPLTVKGKSEPLQTYLVRRAKPRPFRSVARGVAGVETRTVGREAETQALQSAYLQAYQEHGTVWAQLLGDPGVGKSRLLEDMNDWLDLREETFRLLRARAFPDDANQPFALVRRLWFDRFQIAEDAPLAQAEAKWVERFREFSGLSPNSGEAQDYEEPAHALGLLVGLPFENSPHIGAMRNDPAQVKGRALVVSRELIKTVRKQYPLVVLLEDLQWTDTASWEYLVEVFAYEQLDEQLNGMFILGAARNDWQPPKELTAFLRPDLIYIGMGIKKEWEIHLAPLSDQAARELAVEIFQRVENIPAQVLDLLVERSEGVPYYMEEMVNWFVDHGILDTHAEQWHFFPEKLKEQPLPATLQHLLLTRLSSLSQGERSALQRGAIFGRRFWTGGVEALGVPGGAETLVHLQPRGFVDAQPESAFQGDTEWSFHQNLLQEVTYESVLKRERLALHKVAANWLEGQARQAGRLDEFAGLLGEHCERGGELSAAADWYLRAGKRAMGQGAPREARIFFTRAIELLPPVDRERRWLALSGREAALAEQGEVEPWKADITALLELARSFEDDNILAEAYLRQAIFGMHTGDGHLSDQAAREALAAARRCGNEAIEAKALALTAAMIIRRGDKSAAIHNIEEALQLARRLGDESVLSYVLFRAAFIYGILPDIARCFPLYIEHIELDHRLGNRSQEATGLGNMGDSYIWMGLYKQGRLLIEQARTINEALGARRPLADNLTNLGELYRSTGDLRKARQLMEQALEVISPTRHAYLMILALDGLGLVLLGMGDAAGATRRFSEAHELALSQRLFPLACETAAGLAACAIQQGQLEEARKYAQEAWDYLKEHGIAGVERPDLVYRSCAETFDALGEAENARAVLESAHHALLEVADTINLPEWRQSFLENQPDHRAIMEMWERRKQ